MTSFRVTWFCRSVGNLTPTLAQNLIFDLMNLLMQISFRVLVDHKRLWCNRLSAPELVTTHRPFLTRVGSCFQLYLCCTNCDGSSPYGSTWLYVYSMLMIEECTVKDSFPLSCIDMVCDISYAMSGVWYISTFAMLITISIVWFWLTWWFYRCDKPFKASYRVDLFAYLKRWNLENINVLKTPECFGVEKELSVFVSLWTMVLFAWHLIKLQLFAIDFWQRLKDILSLLYNFVLIMVIVFTITLMELRH